MLKIVSTYRNTYYEPSMRNYDQKVMNNQAK